jgi:hypothetical protein
MQGCSAHTVASASSIGPQLPSRPINSVATKPAFSPKVKKIAFSTPPSIVPMIHVGSITEPTVQLCELLGDPECSKCMGIIGHGDEVYHLHPLSKRKEPSDRAMNLNRILSPDFEGFLSRRQRYSIALLLASSVAQLQFTTWLRTGLTKDDVLFFLDDEDSSICYGEPFIRQGFSHDSASNTTAEANDCNFFSLGIVLLELCFGKRLEDHPLRKKHSVGDAGSKHAFDLIAALQWSRNVCDEAGEDYHATVKWCFTGAGDMSKDKSWRSEIIKNVIRPLELCQEHFKTATVT